ncbi:MAG: hypothetical protein O7B99_00695 [Planctomycetota bacterium]|nr:hypothetical protein [Planctomycetota bacterium]
MSQRGQWILIIAGSFVIAVGLIGLILFQQQSIQDNRETGELLRRDIDAGRQLVMKSPDLEREVIIQRETDNVIKEILSDQEDVNNLVRMFNDFEEESGIHISSLRPQASGIRRPGDKGEDFDRVGYSLQFEANAFQLLDFLNLLETHSRFISVTKFKISAAKRNMIEKGAEPVHKVFLDLETYVYKPKEADEIQIDNYDRKRDLLLSDISLRSSELRIPSYKYNGPRGRRDPWVDPRVPVHDGEIFLSIEEQIAIVDGLAELADRVEELWSEVENAENLIAEMKARAGLEEALTKLEEEIRRVSSSDQLVFSPSMRRFENDVVLVAEEVRGKLLGGPTVPQVSTVELREATESIMRHFDAEEYDLALQTYRALEPRLILAERDEHKRPLVEKLHRFSVLAQTVIDFERIEMDIRGVALVDGLRPVALINGDSFTAGEYMDLEGKLFISDIRSHEIEFVFNGVTLIRRIQNQGYGSSSSP